MQLSFRKALLASLLFSPFLMSAAGEEKETSSPDDAQLMKATTQLQVFLDRANFGPGKIDGHYGGFTSKALALYRESQGKPVLKESKDAGQNDKTAEDEKKKARQPLPDLQDLDLSSVDPVFIEYKVTEADARMVGELPKEVPDKARLKWIPYATLPEAIAEKFHSDLDFLEELNPGKLAALKAGDTLKVPNVEPFDMNAVKDMPLLDLADQDKKDVEAAPKDRDKKEPSTEDSIKDEKGGNGALKPDEISVTVEGSDSMLHLHEKGKLVAAFPVTIGSAQTESPQGEWKIKGIARLPDFRYDKSFLKTGERSDDTYLLQPGPNNPVGAVWIALNKSGIGLHGTDDPDSIGRSASHGCVRLANWDIARLASRLRAGVAVTIR
ncbi:L,D-transpeptidase [Prosthecobacter sp. SYSU 5D2]|uniref:L,D-transpeptidase n=1 Tax=Prosthecobacter sp. SYSU 5D2 TaxID=3134134 RepID=UPI0031FED39D